MALLAVSTLVVAPINYEADGTTGLAIAVIMVIGSGLLAILRWGIAAGLAWAVVTGIGMGLVWGLVIELLTVLIPGIGIVLAAAFVALFVELILGALQGLGEQPGA